MTRLRIGAGERAVFIALPGVGKTHLVMWLAEQLSSVVVIDSKQHPGEWPAYGRRHGYLVSPDPAGISRHPKVVFQVDQLALSDREGWQRPGRSGHSWTDALQRILDRGNTLTIFDEVIQTLPAGAPHPLAVKLYTQGRAFNNGIWACTQVANRMETFVPRLAEHCYAFRLQNRQDLDLVRSSRGVDASLLTTLAPRQFAYHRNGAPDWLLCDPVGELGFPMGQMPAPAAPSEAPAEEPAASSADPNARSTE